MGKKEVGALAMWKHNQHTDICGEFGEGQMDIIRKIEEAPPKSNQVIKAGVGRGKTHLSRCLLARCRKSAGAAITHAAAKILQFVAHHTGLRFVKVALGEALPSMGSFWEKRPWVERWSANCPLLKF